jgi:hypothetical protein
VGKNLMCAWLLVALSASAAAQSKVAVSDFGWMSGTWNGNVGGAPVERVFRASRWLNDLHDAGDRKFKDGVDRILCSA